MKYNILIVDDETSVTELLAKEFVDYEEFQIFTMNQGYDALKKIMQGEIDLIVTDIAMPDMDGYELYSRAIEYDPSLSIIMMTGFGYDPNHAVVKSKEMGLQDVIFKPFDTEKLVRMIRKRLAE